MSHPISRRSLGLGAASAAILGGPARAQGDAPRDKSFTTSDGVRIHYLQQGAGSPVILIHGFRSNALENWVGPGTMQALSARHRVIALDCRGHGQSSKPADPAMYAGDRMVQDVLELMDALKIKAAHIGGYSMGAAFVGRLMGMAPERFVTAFLGGGGFPETDPALAAQAAAKDGPSPDPEAVRATIQAELATRRGGEALMAVNQAMQSWRTSPAPIDLTSIAFPVLAVNGEYDRPHSKTQRMERELKHFTNVILPRKTHFAASAAVGLTIALVKFVNANDRR
jgi:pimeloyl-ACP methyl ester carboxylesterase